MMLTELFPFPATAQQPIPKQVSGTSPERGCLAVPAVPTSQEKPLAGSILLSVGLSPETVEFLIVLNDLGAMMCLQCSKGETQ